MSDDPRPSLRDVLLRRDLHPDEERRLARWLDLHPETTADWQSDAAVARALRRLPPVPVPSNFTHQVLARLDRQSDSQTRATRRPRTLRLPWPRWIPAAATLLLLTALGVGWNLHRQHRQERLLQAERELAALQLLAELPPAALEDFEVIRHFGDSWPQVDDELLAALQ
ncbi:MAG: hypothetical protein KF833_22485 [Verrucomicrobiae bacterium]|nr:hypothetical protein [Verrucomicrobiae bacterium]